MKLTPFGIVGALIYFFVFTFFIKKCKVAIHGMLEHTNGGIRAVFGGKADLFSQEINQILEQDN
ncbi:hypothetical protein IGI96_003648 [Enterococcus sp. DIV0421]